MIEFTLSEQDYRMLVKAAIPCKCDLPLPGYWLDHKDGIWKLRCRLCCTEFTSVPNK